ncbi:hypothetical protein GCM10007384_19690 [Aquimarina muelleri]|uniref:Uncharacterized protein n=1 Tax=Aquimarina muelleri TaxID=279356 RepID=A0A918JXQ5_9FLAO|nr:hypothetical protein GCM10007384_19690 [Aquimarina muelleri]
MSIIESIENIVAIIFSISNLQTTITVYKIIILTYKVISLGVTCHLKTLKHR